VAYSDGRGDNARCRHGTVTLLLFGGHEKSWDRAANRLAHEKTRTEFKLAGGDARLVNAVASAVRHTARRAGVPEVADAAFARAAAHACRLTLPLLNGSDPFLHVAIEEFQDRVEVTLEHSGRSMPGSQVESLGENPTGTSALVDAGSHEIDGVHSERYGERSRVTLVKHTQQHHRPN
jgi:hypothetical protein